MGGPSASVLIPARAETELLAELEAWLATIFRPYPPELHLAPIAGYLRLWDGQVLATEALGPAWDSFAREAGDEAQVLERRPSALSLARLEALIDEIGPEKIADLRRILEPPPAYEFSISMMCKERIDHRMLGMLALGAASRFGGWIDFNGALEPRSTPDTPIDPETGFRVFSLEEIRAYVAQLPGRIHEIAYEIDEARSWIYHVADIEFCRAWLAHPHFHMIK